MLNEKISRQPNRMADMSLLDIRDDILDGLGEAVMVELFTMIVDVVVTTDVAAIFSNPPVTTTVAGDKAKLLSSFSAKVFVAWPALSPP